MELIEFISESIKQITDGLIEGNQYIREKSSNSEGIESGYRKFILTLEFNQTSVTKMMLAEK